MALNNDVAFKFGCGRYIQERQAIAKYLAPELKRLGGRRVLFVCGENGYRVAYETIRNALEGTDIVHEVKLFHSTPCFDNARELAQYAGSRGFDLICGVGGGVVADTVKLAAEQAKLSLVQIPTSSATCASVTTLSAMFDRETHAYQGSWLCTKEADAVIVDIDILICQPPRLFWAGMLDAMAKKIEMAQYMNAPKEELPFGLDMAYGMAEQTYRFYCENRDALALALETKEVNKTFEQAVFYAIAVTGIVSGLSKGSKQTALAHHFYEEARTLFYRETKEFLHGELVAVGLIIQLAYCGQDYKPMVRRLREMGLPTTLSELGIAPSEENVRLIATRLCATKTVGGIGEALMRKTMAAVSG